jgi:hypothetical protein
MRQHPRGAPRASPPRTRKPRLVLANTAPTAGPSYKERHCRKEGKKEAVRDFVSHGGGRETMSRHHGCNRNARRQCRGRHDGTAPGALGSLARLSRSRSVVPLMRFMTRKRSPVPYLQQVWEVPGRARRIGRWGPTASSGSTRKTRPSGRRPARRLDARRRRRCATDEHAHT